MLVRYGMTNNTKKGQLDNACELHEFSWSIQDHLFMVPCMSHSTHVWNHWQSFIVLFIESLIR